MILFFDTETTGLPENWEAPLTDLNNWPRLVQIAFLLSDYEGNKISGGDFLIKPEGFSIPLSSSAIHQITTEKANTDGIDLKIVLQLFNKIISQSEIIVAHNIDFDEKIVGAEFLRKGMQHPFHTKRKLCTMKSSIELCAIKGKEGYKFPKLSELYFKLFNSEFEDAHNASKDLSATIRCFWELVKIGAIDIPNNILTPTGSNSGDIENLYQDIEWVTIPEGIFYKGSPEDEVGREEHEILQLRQVNSFMMTKFPITFGQYDLYCEAIGAEKPDDNGWGRGNRPLINISWFEANNFAEWLGCRLPTETEWEYACRCGTKSAFSTGNDLDTSKANFKGNLPYDSNKKGAFVGSTTPVGIYPPNYWGLYDMHGNVGEWCVDQYDRNDEFVPSIQGKFNYLDSRVFRGGHWNSSAEDCRSARRFLTNSPDPRFNFVGFRLVSNSIMSKEIFADKLKQEKTRSGFIKIIEIDRNSEECMSLREKIEWVTIPEGTFDMGTYQSQMDRTRKEIYHKVILNSFKISCFAITFELFDEFCESTNLEKPNDSGWGREDRPVINISWFSARDFAEWIGCRLPTEAEWEYACRAGTTTPFNVGYKITTDLANFNGDIQFKDFVKGEFRGRTLPVGRFLPNAWGLYDMHGNTWEWCNDWYGNYPYDPQINPRGAIGGTCRVIRGGSWRNSVDSCRSANRWLSSPSFFNFDIGFRVVKEEN